MESEVNSENIQEERIRKGLVFVSEKAFIAQYNSIHTPHKLWVQHSYLARQYMDHRKTKLNVSKDSKSFDNINGRKVSKTTSIREEPRWTVIGIGILYDNLIIISWIKLRMTSVHHILSHPLRNSPLLIIRTSTDLCKICNLLPFNTNFISGNDTFSNVISGQVSVSSCTAATPNIAS